MSLPGQRLRAVTVWLFSVKEREQVLDPIVADLQHELAALLPDQRRRPMAILRIHVAFWHAVAAYVSARALRGIATLAGGDATWLASIACGAAPRSSS